VFLFYPVLCDVTLFDGFDYDDSKQSSHLFRDYLNNICDIYLELNINGYGDFKSNKSLIKEADSIFKFVSAIYYGNNNWERIFILYIYR